MTMDHNYIHGFQQYRRFLKSIACITLAAFLSLSLQPLAAAINAPAAPKAQVKVKTNAHHMAEVSSKIERALASLVEKKKPTANLKTLKTLTQELKQWDAKVKADFKKQTAELKAKKLPKVILQRQAEAEARYQKQVTALLDQLVIIEKANDEKTRQQAVTKAHTQLKSHQKKKSQVPFDPKTLSHGSIPVDPNNKPKRKKKDFKAAGLFNNPTTKLASHGSYIFDGLPGANNPAYLEATTEILLTDAIKAKATELNHNPVKIYQWVKNNVEWLPTWGAQQDADVTLGSRRGNSLDIASLLIALYRASGIPARYVHGTIEVSPERFNNWTGGFNDTFAALQFSAFGGIPVTQNIAGGKITSVQLEHVWVEAAIDYAPSRGAINKAADSWVQLDASYKQYEFLQGLDVIQISGIDPNALATSFGESGTINDTEGWVQGLDPAILQAAQTQTQTKLEDHINGMTDPTVGDVIGGKKIITDNGKILPSSLPYKTLVTGARYGYLPVGMQNFMTFAFGKDTMGEWINPVSFPFPYLNNHKVTLSFKPATQADEDALLALLPESEITDPSQLPSSIPSYLINVIPTLAVEGTVRGQGLPMRLGEEVKFIQHVTRRGNIPDTLTYPVTAGSYLNVMVGGGSVSPEKLAQLQTKLTQTKAIFESRDATKIRTLTREDLLGDIFFIGGLGYIGQYTALGQISSLSQKARHGLTAGYGTLGYEPDVFYFFGFPTAIKSGSVAVNVRVGGMYADRGGSKTKRKDFAFHMGMLSSVLEHTVLEQLFTIDPSNPVQGISAVRALQLALQNGQRIYHITKSNSETILPNLNIDSATVSEIKNVLNMNKEVITHTNPVAVPGWSGAGYVIFEPESGQGAFKISGGRNGGNSDIDPPDVDPSAIVLAPLALILSLISPAEASDDTHLIDEIFFDSLTALWTVTKIKVIPIIGHILQAMEWNTNMDKISKACSGNPALSLAFQIAYTLIFAVSIAAPLLIGSKLGVGGFIAGLVGGALLTRAALNAIMLECYTRQ